MMTRIDSKKISVICISWNHEKYIEKALQSVINQSYENLEIIFLDNKSSDNSYFKGLELLNKASIPFKAKQFDSNIGMVKAINFALKNMISSDYVSMIAMDDWLDLDNYKLKIDYSLENPQYGMVYSYGYYYYDNSATTKEIGGESLKEGWIFRDLLQKNFLFMMGTLIKWEVYEEVGFYNESNSIEDWEFALRTAQKFEIGLVRKPLFYYRQHSSNYSKGSYKYYNDCLDVIDQYKNYKESEIGKKWIAAGFLGFLFAEPFSLKNLRLILNYSQLSLSFFKNVLKYVLIVKK